MRFFRSVFALLLWLLALAAAAPAGLKLYPVALELLKAYKGQGAWPWLSNSQWGVELAQGTVGWLILSFVILANATMLKILNSLEKI